ncbi:hypothetical protein ACG83_10935 [Frankia sp. R43]|uniref:hypothetical protein n=1 Tax=Frankia sp. R43 TaxID=269536 RepID=UPI0006CA04FF|nr:hypothetical protein [Frankia sp. R43]KPM55780.1 hypothetical protein ACG83_10935 [Frankia sp. R43]
MANGLDPFVAQFWDEKIAWHANGDRTDKGQQVIRSGGEHYVVGPEGDPLPGFGGHPFAFRLDEGGELFHTANLWHQGAIPDEYADQLPDNAERVQP